MTAPTITPLWKVGDFTFSVAEGVNTPVFYLSSREGKLQEVSHLEARSLIREVGKLLRQRPRLRRVDPPARS